MLAIAGHAVGWPFARGGSRSISAALAAELTRNRGEILTDAPVRTLDEIGAADAILLDLTPRQVLRVAGSRLPAGYRGRLERYRYGPGVFKVDWALSEPIPWTAPACARAGTIHLGGSAEDIARASKDAFEGRVPSQPFVLLTQPSLFDQTRAPPGRHVAWAYCHVPSGSTLDLTDAVEAQVERFAPGFRDVVLGRHTRNSRQLEDYNPNMIGGDITGGVADLRQLFFRPTPRLVPYTTPVDGLYLCSSSTPPGGAVHGMCGWHGARAALRRMGGSTTTAEG
jgi:phytoene dehydrogenase-like protein